MNERNEQSERKVNVIKFEVEEVIGVGDFIDDVHVDMDLDDYSSPTGLANRSVYINRLPIFTIIENEAVPPLQSAMTERAKQILIDQGFTRKKDAEIGRNNRDEVWTKKTNYAASQETVKLAKIILHEILKDNETKIADLLYKNELSKCYLTQSNQTIERLQQLIKTATLWQRVKFLFGGEL
tara:strand:+ start:43841 stop:44386 length:546 start_codon:yes stop_codon:yes gene_type:complete